MTTTTMVTTMTTSAPFGWRSQIEEEEELKKEGSLNGGGEERERGRERERERERERVCEQSAAQWQL